MSEDTGQQRYCTNCGAEVRSGNAFCFSCGQQLDMRGEDHARGSDSSVIVEPTSRDRVLKPDKVRLVLYLVGALLFLIVVYLLLRYSVILGVMWVGLVVLAIALVRRARGSQTRLEQQAFERANHYRESTQRAYEEGKHREFAQNAIEQSKKVYEETQARYRQWSMAQAAERQRNEALRATDLERDARRARFDRYAQFFERAHRGAQTSLEWWQAYENDEGAGEEGPTTDDLLLSARDRAETGSVKMRGFEERFSDLLQADSFAEVDDFLNRLLASQEDFEGEESVFPPLVAVHDRIKHSEGWTNYRRELETFIKNLEDLLDSPAVKTAPANRARFPEPGQERPLQPEGSYSHNPTSKADISPSPTEAAEVPVQQSASSAEEPPGTYATQGSRRTAAEQSSVPREWWERFREWWRGASVREQWIIVVLGGVPWCGFLQCTHSCREA